MKGLEHSPFANLMLLFTTTYRGEHFDTRYYGGNEYIGMVERPYQSPYLSRGYQNDTKKLVGVAGSIQNHILYFAYIDQFVLATSRECAPTNIVLDSNLEDNWFLLRTRVLL
ncbi:hypothetical protein KY290_019959 [Solanum tuberosum]|uniref:Uncharacterized protein n=1 Tax=Solanum tuberosum TaxID=4113 RepID=A0ABQ7VIP5_SOLTU|nr:hypothetical protein KY290_019959 [Solanum tuberosum]